MNYKKTIMEVMNRNGQHVTDENKLIDMVLTIAEFMQIIKELQAEGMFPEAKQKVKELQLT